MVDLKVNTVIYDEPNKLFKVAIPPSIIPNHIKENYQKQIEKLNGIKKDLKKKGLSKKEIREKIKEIKQDDKNELGFLFALFLNLGNNTNLLSFKLNKNKSKYSGEAKMKEATDIVNALKEIKEIQLLPYSSKGSKVYDDFKKDTLDVLEQYKSQISLYEDIMITLLRLMRTTRISSLYYEKNHIAFFKKYLKFTDNESNIITKLYTDNVVNDNTFNTKLEKIPYYEVKK
jgi:hypothetical protein